VDHIICLPFNCNQYRTMAPSATSADLASTMVVPPEWPPDVVDKFTPIRILGKGGFASVILAREKQNPNQMVAIKVVGNTNKKELTYAHREIEILQELSVELPHPNIMYVLHYWEASSNVGHGTTRSGVLALNYVKGPTVESLLQYGGALSTVFSRVVAAQAIDAIAYLHYRAVVHRYVLPLLDDKWDGSRLCRRGMTQQDGKDLFSIHTHVTRQHFRSTQPPFHLHTKGYQTGQPHCNGSLFER
jgi:hypothetical protein